MLCLYWWNESFTAVTAMFSFCTIHSELPCTKCNVYSVLQQFIPYIFVKKSAPIKLLLHGQRNYPPTGQHQTTIAGLSKMLVTF
jgi:hypothetical protein